MYVRAGSLGPLLPGTECRLIDKPRRSLRRMQQKEEDVSRGRTKAGHPLSVSWRAGKQRWILRAPCTPTQLSLVSLPPRPPPIPTLRSRQGVSAAVSEWKDLPACVFGWYSFVYMSISFFSPCRPAFYYFYLFVYLLFCTKWQNK